MAEEHEQPLDEKSKNAWIAGICAFTGMWGILTGFAVFILIRTGDFSNPLVFIAGLAVAAVASSVVEVLREAIRGEISIHPTRRAGSVIVTVVTLLVFELFILASHNAIDIFGQPAEVLELREALIGPAFSGTQNATVDLIVLAAIWVMTGCVVGLALGLFVARDRGSRTMRAQTLRGAVTGIVAATVAAPALVLAYVLIWRICAAIALAIGSPAALATHYQSVILTFGAVKTAGPAMIFIDLGTLAIFGLLNLWLWSAAGKIAVAALLLIVLAIGKRFGEWRPLGIVLTGCFIGIVAPLLVDFGDVFRLALFAAVVWFVPGLVLGLAAPMLEAPSDRANIWAGVATVLGVAVALLTALRWHELASRNVLLLALAVTFFAAALLFTRLRDLREFWPALALCLSAIAASLTFLLVSLTASFHTVLTEVATIDSLPASIAPSPNIVKLQHDVPYDDLHSMETFASLGTMSIEDREAALDSARTALLAARPRAAQQLAEIARQGRPPVTLSAATLDDTAAVRAFARTIEQRSQEQMDRDVARFKASTGSARYAADADERWWSRYSAAVAIAAGRVIGIDDERNDIAAIENDDIPAKSRIAADRAFSVSAAPEQLEAALAGSFAFWLTVGLLSAWAIRRRETDSEATEATAATT